MIWPCISVLTPIRAGEACADDVSMQQPWKEHPYRRFCHPCEVEGRRKNEALNRNSLKMYGTDPCILMDADVVCPDPATFVQMLDFLMEYDFPAVAVDTKNRSDGLLARDCDIGHTIIALIAMRKKVLDMILFAPLEFTLTDERIRKLVCLREPPEADACICTQVNMQIRTMTGYPIPYLRNVRATERH